MTNEEKARIVALRDKGWGAIKIVRDMVLSENTVKPYLRRNENKYPVCGKPLNGSVNKDGAQKFYWKCSDQDTYISIL